MKSILSLILFFFSGWYISYSQDNFNYRVELKPIIIDELPGLHSFSFAQYNDYWLIIGGRRDGIHARQPFNAFPSLSNNTDIYVIDYKSNQFWTKSVNTLPTSLKEQLQSTNMNFTQDGQFLYIVGGYAFSASKNNHITFPNLTKIDIAGLIDAIITGEEINEYFLQIEDDFFAVTGGHLKKLGDDFYLVGGHRFDGRYNPMGPNHGPGFSQSYTNQIRIFDIEEKMEGLQFNVIKTYTDPVHLRRRDYNLLPQIFPDGEAGLTISSGVFQIDEDLPFLYPVDIRKDGYYPITTFSQYLSNYHSAVACLYDSIHNEMHSLFFGGISQYYFQNGTLIKDDRVPFVKTISRLTRYADSSLQEFQLPEEMPAFLGAGAEFIPNVNLSHYNTEIIKLHEIDKDSTLIGHILGGIISPSPNPFDNNMTSTTRAANTIFEIWLIKESPSAINDAVQGTNPYDFSIYPNPAQNAFVVIIDNPLTSKLRYYIHNMEGKLLEKGIINELTPGNKQLKFQFSDLQPQTLMVSLVFNDKFYVSKKLLIK